MLFSIISNIYAAIPRANVEDFISSFLKAMKGALISLQLEFTVLEL